MKNDIRLNLILVIFTSSLLFSCSSKNNNTDFDFTSLKKPKKVKLNNNENKNKELNIENSLFKKDLVALKDKQEILSKIEFGKKDPFSKGEIKSNKLNSNFEITGFLNTEFNNYVFVSYLDYEGAITEDSIGGVNTNLLPFGAKVIDIDPKNMKLIINLENEDFIFEM